MQTNEQPKELSWFELDDFQQSYVKTALWSECDGDQNPLDDNYGPEDIDSATLAKMAADCDDFRDLASEELDEAEQQGQDDARAGHNFWLNRNGHGAGFWDEGLGALGQKLDIHSKSFGSYNLYVGDDGKIYGA